MFWIGNLAAGHSPNRAALATRNSVKIMNFATGARRVQHSWSAVDKAWGEPYLSTVVSVAKALILLPFFAVEPELPSPTHLTDA
jgi:hypothetical protein